MPKVPALARHLFLMAKRIYQRKAKVVHNSHIIKNYYKLALHSPEIVRVAQPGQFLMLRVSGKYQPLLRRPFSIHKVGYRLSVIGYRARTLRAQYRDRKPDTIEILYEVVGKGTKILSEKKPGELLDVLGPLGNGFSILGSRCSILVGGGIGVAPLFFLAQKLMERNLKPKPRTPNPEPRNAIILIGTRTKKEILSQKEFANLGSSVKISTEDGSAGFKGKVTDLLKKILVTRYTFHVAGQKLKKRVTSDVRRETIIYACGPKPMLSEIAIISKQYNIPAQISLDEYMACGLGVCLGCMVKTKEGQRFVCRDGPVFDVSKIKWYNK